MATLEQTDEGPIAQINIIPFVDIVLVLLIIFMLTSGVIIKASLRVDLPKAASAGQEVAATVNLVYTRDGTLFLNGTAQSEAEVAAWVREAASQTPQLQAVISADQGVAYGAVVRIIDLVKQSGVTAFALNIERTWSNPPPAASATPAAAPPPAQPVR